MKIAEFIKKNHIKPSDCVYHTWRQPLNKKKERAGNIRVIVWKKEAPKARVEYTCPECGFTGYLETVWKRPFFIRCEKCGFRISVPRMKDEIKRERKQLN